MARSLQLQANGSGRLVKAIASADADGRESAAVAGSFVVIDRGYSQSRSFSQAQSSSLP